MSKEWKYICELNIRQREELKLKNLLNNLRYKFKSSIPFRLILSKIKSEYYEPPHIQYKCAICKHPVCAIGVCKRLHFTRKTLIKKILLPVLISCITVVGGLQIFKRNLGVIKCERPTFNHNLPRPFCRQ